METAVLCKYDTRHIQSYIFSGSDEAGRIGAGILVAQIIPQALQASLCACGLNENEYDLSFLEHPERIPFFDDPAILAQLISVGAGNAVMLYRSEELCRSVNRRFSRYVLEHTYSLQIDMAITPMTNSFRHDYMMLYRKIDIASNRACISHPLAPLPIVETESATGNPVSGYDARTGETVSLETLFKRERTPCGHAPVDAAEGLAYIHIDGNDMSLTVSRIMSSIEEYRTGIAAIRKLTAGITNTYLCAMEDIEKALCMRYGDCNRVFRRLNIGGDDVNLLCSAEIAYDAADLFAKRVSETPLWQNDDTGTIPLSVSVGIAFVNEEIPYRMGQTLSDACCETAKAFAKSRRKNGFVENCVYASHFRKANDGSWIKCDCRDDQPFKIPKE